MRKSDWIRLIGYAVYMTIWALILGGGIYIIAIIK